MSYYLCARQIGQCVGLGRGIKEYHLCARNANCKKMDREKVEKVVKKIKEREKNKQVERIGNFLYVAQSRPANLKFDIEMINEYQSHIKSSQKPRIRKKTKDYWLEQARKAKELVNLKSAWMKKNFPNADINDPTLPSQLNHAMITLEKRKKQLKNRTVARNRRTSSINTAIREYNKDKAKQIIKKSVANKGNKKEEEIKKLKDMMNEVIEKGSTKYMYNLIKNEKDPKNAQKKINKNQINLSNLEKESIGILSKLYDNIGAEKGRQTVGTALIGKFKQASRLNSSRAKAVIKKYYKNR